MLPELSTQETDLSFTHGQRGKNTVAGIPGGCLTMNVIESSHSSSSLELIGLFGYLTVGKADCQSPVSLLPVHPWDTSSPGKESPVRTRLFWVREMENIS